MGAVSGGPRQIGTVQESVFGCLSLGTTYLNGPIAGVSGVAEKRLGFLLLKRLTARYCGFANGGTSTPLSPTELFISVQIQVEAQNSSRHVVRTQTLNRWRDL